MNKTLYKEEPQNIKATKWMCITRNIKGIYDLYVLLPIKKNPLHRISPTKDKFV